MKYALDENYLYSEIRDCINDYESWQKYSEMIPIRNDVYGYVFESTMTGIAIAIVSDDITDVENITMGDAMEWLENVQEEIEPYDSFKGIPIEQTEGGSLEFFDNMLIFHKPLDVIINDIRRVYGSKTSIDAIEKIILCDYAKKQKTLIYLNGDALYPNSEVVPVGYESWSF